MGKPTITVILPFYNAADYLKASLESILNQSYPHFQVFLINDGSTDDSFNVIQNLLDHQRIIYFENKSNKGLIYTLNQALHEVNTPFFARMDADDIAHPLRLEKQIHLLTTSSEIGACGTAYQIFGDEIQSEVIIPPLSHEEITCELLFRQPILHPSFFAKTEIINTSGLRYDACFPAAEDYWLFTQLTKATRFANLKEVLMLSRQHKKQVSSIFKNIQAQSSKKVIKEQLHGIRIEPSPTELNLHYYLMHENDSSIKVDIEGMRNMLQWLTKLLVANQQYQHYPEPHFTQLLERLWHKHTAGLSRLGLRFGALFARSPFSEYHHYSLWQKAKFWTKCLVHRS